MKFNLQTATLGTILLMAPAAWGQAPGGAAAPMKVAVLNVQQAILGTAEGKQSQAELQSQFAPRQTELENLTRQISDIRDRLDKGQRTLSEDEKLRLQRQGETLSRQLQRKQEDLQQDINESRGDVINRIGQKLLEVLDRYARENNYSLVLDNSGQATSVLWAATPIDITQDIIRLYDQANPIRSAAPAAPQPGTPRPAPPGTQRPPQQTPPPRPPQQ